MGAIPTYCIMRKQELEKENKRLNAELENVKFELDIYKTVLGKLSRQDLVQIELNKIFKELLCKKK